MNYNIEICQDRINVSLEECENKNERSQDLNNLKNEISSVTVIECNASLLP